MEVGTDHVAVGDGVEIVVRDGGQIAWVRRDGCTFAGVDDDVLVAADPDTVWLADGSGSSTMRDGR